MAYSPLAFWLGGSGSAPSSAAAAVRSPLAFWLGGAASVPGAGAAGVRSPLAFWLGGAGSVPAASSAGARSLLAFWLGGGASLASGPAPPTETFVGNANGPRRHRLDDMDRLIREEDELMIIIAAALHVLNR